MKRTAVSCNTGFFVYRFIACFHISEGRHKLKLSHHNRSQMLDTRDPFRIPEISILIIGQWWCTPLIPALGRERQADF